MTFLRQRFEKDGEDLYACQLRVLQRAILGEYLRRLEPQYLIAKFTGLMLGRFDTGARNGMGLIPGSGIRGKTDQLGNRFLCRPACSHQTRNKFMAEIVLGNFFELLPRTFPHSFGIKQNDRSKGILVQF